MLKIDRLSYQQKVPKVDFLVHNCIYPIPNLTFKFIDASILKFHNSILTTKALIAYLNKN